MHIALIAVPYDSGFRAKRMGAGPLHLLDPGLSTELEAAGHVVTTKTLALSIASRPAEIAATFELSGAVAHAVAAAVAAGSFPLVLSGNCGPAALGCVGGLQGRRCQSISRRIGSITGAYLPLCRPNPLSSF